MLICVFCIKECKNHNSLRNHERLCKLNPDKQESNLAKCSTKIPWNKGLTKEDDLRLLKASENVSKTMKELFSTGFQTTAHKEEYWTEERRKEKSEWRIQLHKDDPETHPNRKLAGNRNKMSYPEKVAFDYLTSNNLEFEHQKQVLNFNVDFCIGNKIIEIDGERWHPIGNVKDAERDVKIREQGYEVYRIRSKEPIENRIKEILSVV